MTIVLREKDDAKALQKLKAVMLEGSKTAATAQDQAATEQAVKPLLSPWFRMFLALDPRPYLQKVRVPVLALNGERDIQVPVENLDVIKQALANDKDVTVKAMPGLNHLFQSCKKCDVNEYGELEETMSPPVVQLVVAWVHKHAR